MGNPFSKSTTESEERKRQAVLQDITSYLELHREIVYGISSSIDTEQENVKLVIKSIKEFIRSDKEKHENVENLCKDVIKTAENLLGSIQNTLVCQSKALTLSYNSMNKFFHNVLDSYRHGDPHISKKAKTSESCNSESSVDPGQQHDVVTELEPTTDWSLVNVDIKNGVTSFTDDEKGAEIPKPIRTILWEDYLKYKKECKVVEKQRELLLQEHEIEKEQHQACQNELNQLKTKLDCQTEEITNLSGKLQTLNSTIKQFETDKTEFLETILHLENENQELVRKNEEHQDHRTVIKEHPKKRMVQLYFQMKGDLTLKVLDELKSAIVSRMGIRRDELCFVTCLNNSDVNPDHEMLVICINMSRLGTDVSAILQTIKASPKVYLVVLHHKDGHALPSQTSDRVLTGPEFQSLGGIFDLAFLSEKGIYACDMNNKAVDAIVNVIK